MVFMVRVVCTKVCPSGVKTWINGAVRIVLIPNHPLHAVEFLRGWLWKGCQIGVQSTRPSPSSSLTVSIV